MPAPDELAHIAASIRPDSMPLFTKHLLGGACKKRHNPRYREVNRARLELARLCIDQMLEQSAELSSHA